MIPSKSSKKITISSSFSSSLFLPHQPPLLLFKCSSISEERRAPKSLESSFSSVYYSKRWRLNFDDSILSLGVIGSGVVNHFPWDLKFNQQSLKSAFLDQRRWRDREHYHFCSCGGRISSHRSPFSYQKRIW